MIYQYFKKGNINITSHKLRLISDHCEVFSASMETKLGFCLFAGSVVPMPSMLASFPICPLEFNKLIFNYFGLY